MAPVTRNLHPQNQKPNGTNTKTLKPAVLGLDVGTTATRASLASLDHDLNKPPDIILRPNVDRHRERFDAGDFPSAANFFAFSKSPELCIGYIGDDPDQTPVKMYPYIARIKVMRELGRDTDKGLEEEYRDKIPQINRFFNRFDGMDESVQRRVMAHARQVFLAHLRHVRSSAQVLAEVKGWKITKVAATIPPNWDRWTQHLYIRLLQSIWNDIEDEDSEAITLLNESESIGHWLLCLDQKTKNERPKRLIFADFGGHTLSHSVFEICYRDDNEDEFAFFTLSPDDCSCMHGGSELHASFVKDKIQKEIMAGRIPVPQKYEHYLYETLMNDYRLYHRGNVDGGRFSIRGWSDPGRGKKPVEVPFYDNAASSLYDKCFAKPLAELYSVFRKNAKLGKGAVVVLSGGTFSNSHVLEQTKREIKKAGLKFIPWTEAIAVEGRKSSSVAVGAALALIRTVSVKQFMRQAAFAVNVKNFKKSDLPVIWNSRGSQEATITLNSRQGGDVFIACCPLPPRDGSETVPIGNTFEFQSLSKKVKGIYTISLDYKERDVRRGLPDRLIMTVIQGDAGKPGDEDRVEWPVYYDPGSCAIFVDIDEYDQTPTAEKDIPQLAPKLFRNKKGTNSYLLWEKNRCDPGRFFWEGKGRPSLPLYTLKQFEEDNDRPAQSEMEIVDVDSAPESIPPTPRDRNGHGSCTGKSRFYLKRSMDVPHPQKRKQSIRTDSEQRRSKRREAARLTTTSTGSQGNLHTATICGAEGEFTDCSVAPVKANLQAAMSSRLEAERDVAYSDLEASRESTPSQVGLREVTFPSPRQNISSHGSNKLNQETSIRGCSEAPVEDSQPGSHKSYMTTTIPDSERPERRRGDLVREQVDTDTGRFRLSVSTRPNASPWAERLKNHLGLEHSMRQTHK